MKDALTYAHDAGFFSFNVVGWKNEFERLIEAVRADTLAELVTVKESLTAQDHSADAGNKVSDHIAGGGKVIPQFIPVGIVNDHHSITWMEEIVDDQAPIGAILYALQDSVGRNVFFAEDEQ